MLKKIFSFTCNPTVNGSNLLSERNAVLKKTWREVVRSLPLIRKYALPKRVRLLQLASAFPNTEQANQLQVLHSAKDTQYGDKQAANSPASTS